MSLIVSRASLSSALCDDAGLVSSSDSRDVAQPANDNITRLRASAIASRINILLLNLFLFFKALIV